MDNRTIYLLERKRRKADEKQRIIPHALTKILSPPSIANLLLSFDTVCSLRFRSICSHSCHNQNFWSSLSVYSSHLSSVDRDNPCHSASLISLAPISEAGWLSYHKSTWKVFIGAEVSRVDDLWLVQSCLFLVKTAIFAVRSHERRREIVPDKHVQRIKNIDGVTKWIWEYYVGLCMRGRRYS